MATYATRLIFQDIRAYTIRQTRTTTSQPTGHRRCLLPPLDPLELRKRAFPGGLSRGLPVGVKTTQADDVELGPRRERPSPATYHFVQVRWAA